MQTKWIDLGDPLVKLKLGQISGGLYLFIIGLPSNAPQWARAVNELAFSAAQNNRYLVRRIREGESPRASTFRGIWPNAGISMMERDAFFLDFSKSRREKNRSQEDRQTEIDLTLYRRLGRNANGDEVLTGSLGRIVKMPDDTIVREADRVLRAPLFLRVEADGDLDLCADGFVRSMDKGEVQYREDFERFIGAVYGEEQALVNGQGLRAMRAHVHASMLRQIRSAHDTAQDAFGDAARLYDFLPPFWGDAPGAGALPLPVAVISQRLLGDTSGKVVLVPNAFDGAMYSFLPDDSLIHSFRGVGGASGGWQNSERVAWHQVAADLERVQSDAIFFNADPVQDSGGRRTDYMDATRMLRTLSTGGRAVLALAGDDPHAAGVVGAESEQFLRMLAGRYEIEDAFELGAEMTKKLGTDSALRVITLRNVTPSGVVPLSGDIRFPRMLPVLHGWDDLKSRVDESIARAAVREAISDDVNLQGITEDNKTQRPYQPFSKIGEAKTMVPSNLQGPLLAALADVEIRYGAVDAFVSEELGFFENTLAERFSPEQIDAIALSMSRIKTGRANILGDETGIGKGRTLGALAVWANKQGKAVVFITDRANLFSDFYAGDLGDLGERGRFRPLILNSNEPIVDKNSPLDPPPILVSASVPDDIIRIVESNTSLAELGVNIVFATYSQLNGAGSEKATWLKNQLTDALLIVDEAHIAAGADSNISNQIQSMAQLSWGVQYSTATWAKSSRNLGIYSRALPETINTASLSKTMAQGGEAFSELFSTMLARDGALTRREHDLSRMERVIEIDEIGRARNIEVSDAIAAVMNQIAIVSGDVDRMMVRANADVMRDLRNARDVRAKGLQVNVFSASFGAGSVLYQVNRRVLAALNAQHVVRLCIKSLEDGLRPIVIFDDTGEALTNQLLDEAAQVNEDGVLVRPDVIREPTVKDLLRQVLNRLSRVRITAKNADILLAAEDVRVRRAQAQAGVWAEGDDAEPETESTDDALTDQPDAEDGQQAQAEPDDRADIEGAVAAMADAAPGKKSRLGVRYVTIDEMPGLSDDQRVQYKRGISRIAELIETIPYVPLNAPDVVHGALRAEGYRTGEISGRSFQLQRTGEGDLCRVVPRSKKKSFVTATVRAYQNGEIDVVAINKAAATGIGLHAQPRFADPRKRNAIWLQCPENATEVSQLAGRSNRYDQVCAPRMTFAATGLYGETRQIMMNNRKQVMMACNVRSSRDSVVKHETVPDLLNVVGQDAVRQVLIDNPGYCQRMGIPPEKIEDKTCDPTRWLNRIPMLTHGDQEKIYSDIYACFDEAILHHDLAGTNPLKALERDIGAVMGERSVFIGVETGGIGSAFDGPVYLQSIAWKERLNPMSWASVEELISKSRRALGASGRVAMIGEHERRVPLLDMSDLREKTTKQVNALMRIALAATEYESVEAALLRCGKNHPVRRAFDRMNWVESNLDGLLPGAVLFVADEVRQGVQRQSVVTGIEIPQSGREHQFGRWKIHTVAPGEGAPVTYTLASIVSSSGELVESGSVIQSVIGSDLYEAGKGDRMRAVMAERFDRAPSGLRDRVSNVLTGNMYLASEWASATKMGRGAIFTDDRRIRHRGVMLEAEFMAGNVEHLPVRLWNREMIRTFVERSLFGDSAFQHGGILNVDQTFGSAWANAQGDSKGRKGAIVFQRDVGVTLSVPDPVASRRLGVALRTALGKIRFAAAGNKNISALEDPLHLKISVNSRKGHVAISAKTQEQMCRAIDVLIAGGGLELYALKRSDAGELAEDVIRDYFEGLRVRAEGVLEATRAERDGDGMTRSLQGGDVRSRMAA